MPWLKPCPMASWIIADSIGASGSGKCILSCCQNSASSAGSDSANGAGAAVVWGVMLPPGQGS